MLRAGFSVSGLTLEDLWFGCLSVGESPGPGGLAAALAGRRELTDHQHDVVAQALNDRLIEMGLDHLVPYAGELR